jgi:hypothetical protein
MKLRRTTRIVSLGGPGQTASPRQPSPAHPPTQSPTEVGLPPRSGRLYYLAPEGPSVATLGLTFVSCPGQGGSR